MKKRSYRWSESHEVRWGEVADRVKDKAVVWAVDVAKVQLTLCHSVRIESRPIALEQTRA